MSVGLSLCMCMHKRMYWNPLVGSWGAYLGGKENQMFFYVWKKNWKKNPGSKSLNVYYEIGGGINLVSMGIQLVLDLFLVFLLLQHHRIQIPLSPFRMMQKNLLSSGPFFLSAALQRNAFWTLCSPIHKSLLFFTHGLLDCLRELFNQNHRVLSRTPCP